MQDPMLVFDDTVNAPMFTVRDILDPVFEQGRHPDGRDLGDIGDITPSRREKLEKIANRIRVDYPDLHNEYLDTPAFKDGWILVPHLT